MTQNQEKLEKAWWEPALALFIRLSAWVAMPVVIATFVGAWLDKKYNSAPFGLIGIVSIAFVLSMIGLVYEAGKEYKQITRIDKNKNKNNN